MSIPLLEWNDSPLSHSNMGVIPKLNFFLTGTSSSVSDYDSPLAWLKVLIFLVVLGVIAYALNYFSKKRNSHTLIKGKSKLSIVDTCSLGNRQFIVVAQYESERHLLAVCANGVSHLAELSSKKTPIENKPSEE